MHGCIISGQRTVVQSSRSFCRNGLGVRQEEGKTRNHTGAGVFDVQFTCAMRLSPDDEY